MCTVSLNIDETIVRRINPNLTSRESIGQWLQLQVDEWLKEMAVKHSNMSLWLINTDGSVRLLMTWRMK